MLTVACVCTGTKYPWEYVLNLQSMVSRNLSVRHRFICLTDRKDLPTTSKIQFEDISKYSLPGWWAKLILFNSEFRAIVSEDKSSHWLYFDLDTVILGSINRLAQVKEPFSICQNFHWLRGNKSWCRFGSCVMTFSPGWGSFVWNNFMNDCDRLMRVHKSTGDQKIVELYYPNAFILQEHVNEGYFLHYKDMSAQQNSKAKVLIFGGRTKPKNCQHEWVKKYWR